MSYRTANIKLFGWVFAYNRTVVGTSIWLTDGKGPVRYYWFTKRFKWKPK